MNSLNLRVSTIKTTENIKKNAEIRSSIVLLPASIKMPTDILKQFECAESIPRQIAIVKEIYSSEIHTKEDKIEFLVKLYFNSPLKHPLRSQSCKLIQENSNNEIVLSKMSLVIDNILKECEDLETIPCERINAIVTSLSGCFENFIIGKNSLKKQANRFLDCCYASLQKYLKFISLATSPSVKNELYLFMHNSIRIILLCIQEFSEELSNLYKSNITKLLRNISIDMIKDIYMPMDIKTNIGILLAYIAHISKEYNNWLNAVIDYKPLYIEEYVNNSFQLCAGIGLINTIKYIPIENNLDKIYIIVKKISLIANRYSSESGMLLAATRSLFQFSKILLSSNVESKLDEIILFCQLLFDYAFSYFEHHLDSIRHITKDLLKSILIICSKYKLNSFLKKIYLYIFQDEVSLSVKCILISNLAKVCGAHEIIEKIYKNIFDDFFTKDNFTADLKVPNCFENLAQASYVEMDFEKWTNIYVKFLIKNINMVDEEHKQLYQNLLDRCIKFAPELASYLIEQRLQDLELNIKLSILCTIRKNGFKSIDFSTMNQYVSDIKEVFLLNSDDMKISALRLLAECHKSTEELTESECDNLMFCLQYNANCQNPETRQKLLSLSHKMLTRLDINLKKIIKARRYENELRCLHFYYKFIKNFVELLCQNLFTGANFSRRFLSLELFRKILMIIRDNNLNLENFLPRNCLNVIFLCLDDSYEINKTVALDILKIFIDAKYGQFIVRETLIKNFLVSVKPTDSVSAAYYLEFYCHLYNVDDFINFFEIEEHFSLPLYKPVQYCAVKMVINILNSGLTTGERSILLAAVSNPLYGSLLTVKHVLSKLDFNMLSQEKVWREFINDFILINKKASKIVAPVVNSSSPEGYFPHDIFSKIENESDNFTHNKTLQPTPQMVLICAWRTIKEVSLILGEFSLRATIKTETSKNKNALLTYDQILDIGEHFKLLLFETKHRGAFEQAYVGFSKLCTRLWSIDQEELNILPMKWLTELLDIISKDENNEKICATRRSAGIPFMVQALITSELQVGTAKALRKCMKILFEICYGKKYSTESKTHSLNILRALFRCTDLNEVCNEYIADGIICAIKGYNGYTWSERNSSTLLFAALITRIFGVQRTKDSENLNIRNKMTGRIFFLRFPKLFDFFLNELKEAASKIENNEKSNKLHPLLLILSRLYPSALEGTESHLKISMFVSFITPCSASSDFQTRILIAKSIVAFVPVDLIEERIYTILSIIKIKLLEGNLNANYFHGLLLQVLFILKSLKQKKFCVVNDIVNDLLIYQNNFVLNPIVMRTIIQIFCEILRSKEIPFTHIVKKFDTLRSSPFYSDVEYSKYYSIYRKTFYIFELQIDLLNHENLAAEIFWEKKLKASNNIKFCLQSFEETETYLNIILLILFNDTATFEEIINECECHKCEIEFLKMLSDKYILESTQYLKSSPVLESQIQKILELGKTDSINKIFLIKAFAILSHLNILKEFDIKDLISYSEKYSSDFQNSIALTINSFLKNNGWINVNQCELLEYLKKISQPWNNFSVRFSSSLILEYFFNIFVDNIKYKNENFVSEFSSIVLSLLMDDDAEIRESASKQVLAFCLEHSSKRKNIVSTFAQKVFIDNLIENLVKSSNYDINFIRRVFCNIISILKGESDKNYKETNSDLEVFDKNEVNIFAEPQKIVLDFSNIFYEIFHERLY